ncbi:MAG: YdcF family protein [Moraxellaceae bacterium]|nr:YdcF family protein [Moraxellaceae bacterium]
MVTDAWHMSRSVLAFKHFGFSVIPAPTEFPEGFFINPQALLQPTAMMFSANLRGLAEVLGHVKYRVRYWFD